jgi:hypothetical protein
VLATTDAEMLAEAAMLREHRNRLENRMVVLEEHNHLLESQLHKLKGVLEVTFLLISSYSSFFLSSALFSEGGDFRILFTGENCNFVSREGFW